MTLQPYYYNFNSHTSLDAEVISGPNDIVYSYPGYKFCYMCGDNDFHLLSISTKGDYWLPYDWEKLKSYINGKKVYLKGMKPKEDKE